MTQSLVFPEAQRTARLVVELCALFKQLTCVRRIAIFGSFARGEADRWSDIDLLVITRSGPADYWQVFASLQKTKRVLHHHIFIPHTSPAGGSLLGILFEDESVFHNVDLNFLCEADVRVANHLERFGPLRWVYEANPLTTAATLHSAGLPPRAILTQHPDDKRIGEALHWTKKAVKHILRSRGSIEAVRVAGARLEGVMQDFPEDISLPTGNLSRAARIYLQIVRHLTEQ